jgi:hypothetical protein
MEPTLLDLLEKGRAERVAANDFLKLRITSAGRAVNGGLRKPNKALKWTSLIAIRDRSFAGGSSR